MVKKLFLVIAMVSLSANSFASGEWWSANSSFTSCFQTKGPADKLDS